MSLLVKFPEFCYGVKESFEEHLVIIHSIERIKDTEPDTVQSHIDHYFCYFADEAEMDRFRIVLSQSLYTTQKKKKFLVILNRESGQGRAGNIYDNHVKPMLNAASCSHVLKESEYNRHISLFATQFDSTAIDGIILIGGDGTVNEFLNGFYTRKDILSIQNSLPITLVPCGNKLQLASRFSIGDPSLAVFSALRGKTFNLYPIAFVQARRRFYGHSYLQINPKKRVYIKLYYLNSTHPSQSTHLDFNDTETIATASADSIVTKGPALKYYHKFSKLDWLGKDVSSATIAIGPSSDLQLSNTFDPTQKHPLAIMNRSTKSNPIQKLWNAISCRRLLGGSTYFSSNATTTTSTLPSAAAPSSLSQSPPSEYSESWPRLLAMTKAGYLHIEDTTQFPPSLNKERWFVDGEIIGTESIYFESLDIPILMTVPPDCFVDNKNNNNNTS